LLEDFTEDATAPDSNLDLVFEFLCFFFDINYITLPNKKINAMPNKKINAMPNKKINAMPNKKINGGI